MIIHRSQASFSLYLHLPMLSKLYYDLYSDTSILSYDQVTIAEKKPCVSHQTGYLLH